VAGNNATTHFLCLSLYSTVCFRHSGRVLIPCRALSHPLCLINRNQRRSGTLHLSRHRLATSSFGHHRYRATARLLLLLMETRDANGQRLYGPARRRQHQPITERCLTARDLHKTRQLSIDDNRHSSSRLVNLSDSNLKSAHFS